MLQAGKSVMLESTSHSRTQTIISLFIIILLVLVAVAVGLKQKSYQNFIPDQTILSNNLLGSDFTAAGDVETYNSDNLYEKIDGKADLYLGNGFVSLQCRRFADKSKKDSWVEVYLYDMAEGENAFAVYSLQKRSESKPLDWARFGYWTSDSVYVAAGRYYVEILLSSENDSLLASAKIAAKQLASTVSTGRTEIPILNLFPAENLVADSFKFINADAFGCSDLKNIFTAEYKIKEDNITAYLSKDNASEMYKKYYRFLIDNGAKELQHNIKLPDCKAAELFGTTETFFTTNDYFGGVRGSAPMEDLQQTAKKLIESLSKKQNGTER
jgi:Uri superfamily endonuclease